MIVHSCGPSNMGGSRQEDLGLRLSLGKNTKLPEK
jgi:hypothetical protein